MNEMRKASYILSGDKYSNVVLPSVEGEGVNQESIFSPFLFNIYLYELDVFIEKQNSLFTNKQFKNSCYGNAKARKSYNKLIVKYSVNILIILRFLGNKEIFFANKEQDFKKHYKKYVRKYGIDYNKLYILYVCYADDFLIGLIDPRKFALES